MDYANANDNDNGKQNSKLEMSVQEILDQLVTHFRQKIHAKVLAESCYHHSNDLSSTGIQVLSDDAEHEECKQPGSSTHPAEPPPPIVQFWLDRLLTLASLSISTTATGFSISSSSSRKNETILQNDQDEGIIGVILEWIRGYKELVRPFVFHATTTTTIPASSSDDIPTFDVECLSVLKNYELIFSKLLSKWMALANDRKRTGPILAPLSALSTTTTVMIPSFSSPKQQSLQTAINIMSTDITLLTVRSTRDDSEGRSSGANKDEKIDETNYLRKSVALPTVLKILAGTLETLRLLVATKKIAANKAGDNPTTTTRNKSNNNALHECYGCLRRCSMTLLAFELPEIISNDNGGNPVRSLSIMLSPHHLAPSLSSSPRDCQSTDLQAVRRMLQRMEDNSSRNPGNVGKSRSTFSSSYSTNLRSRYIDGGLGNGSSTYNDIDDDYWNKLQSNSSKFFSVAEWVDPKLDNAETTISLVVRSAWPKIAYLLTVLLNQDEHGPLENLCRERKQNSDTADIISAQRHHHQQIDFVLKTLGGAGPLLRDARSHFFGRDLHGLDKLRRREDKNTDGDDSIIPPVVVRMGRRVIETTKKKSPLDESPYQKIPSRVAAAMNTLRLLLVPAMVGNVTKSEREKILDDIFPICATLVDSNSSIFGALGAAGFLRAIDALQPSKRDPDSKDATKGRDNVVNLYDRVNVTDDNTWTTFSENALSVLDRCFRSSSDPCVIIAIGRAQTKILGTMISREKERNDESRKQAIIGDDCNRFRRRRRTVTGQWLTTLERSLHRPTTKRQSLELLLGGVIPLLSEHAMDEENGADGMEVGRLGLAALLPLTNTTTNTDVTEHFGGDNIERKTQMASMVALINLMFTAHPVMPSHGGKILSHLLATAAASTPKINPDNSEHENEKENDIGIQPTIASIRSMTVLTAAIALVICGPMFAGELLESIEKAREKYQPELLTVVSEVRELAQALTVNS